MLTKEQVTEALVRVGLIPVDQDSQFDVAFNVPSDQELSDLVEKFQKIHGLETDGFVGPVTERKLTQRRFCAMPDRLVMAASQACRWDHTKWTNKPANPWGGSSPVSMPLTYGINGTLNGFDQQATYLAFAQGLDALSAVCAVTFTRIDNISKANIRIDFGDIDGPSGTLAWCQLPCGPDTPTSQLKSQFDAGEPWQNAEIPTQGRLDVVRVITHEIGHGLGLEHGPTGALMAPYYDDKIRIPQEWDKQQLQMRYGGPIVQPPQPPPPVDPTSPLIIKSLEIEGGKRYKGTLNPF